MVSNARDDLPEPDSPVKTISRSRGRSTDTFWRLCSRAPRTTSRSDIPLDPTEDLATIGRTHVRLCPRPKAPMEPDGGTPRRRGPPAGGEARHSSGAPGGGRAGDRPDALPAGPPGLG